jgi:site-specific DNA-methyltransferase (adenine-specific)
MNTTTLLDVNIEIERATRWLDELIDHGTGPVDAGVVPVVEGLIRQLEASAVRESLARALVAERGLQLADTGELWRVVQGDALALLRQIPDESIDGVFTDPPYSSGGQFRGDRNAQSSDKYQTAFSGNAGKFPEIAGDNRDQRSYLAWCSLWIAECRRVLRPAAPFAVYTDWRQIGVLQDALQCGGLIMRGVAPWIKPTVRPNAGRFRQSAEFLVWGTNGPTEVDFDRWCGPGHWIVPVRLEREHMTEKPVEIARDFARLTAEGGIILDPFAGAATAGVGALIEGRRFLGFELVPACVEVARRWLGSIVDGADRFAVAAGQGSLFADGGAK